MSLEEANIGEIETAITAGLAFVIPEGQKDTIISIIREESSFGMTHSDERAVDNIITGNPREGSNYVGIPLRANEKNPVFMYFLYGTTKEQTEEPPQEETTSDLTSEADTPPAEETELHRVAA